MLHVIFVLIGLRLRVALWLQLYNASWLVLQSRLRERVLFIDEKEPGVFCVLHVEHFRCRLKVRLLIVDTLAAVRISYEDPERGPLGTPRGPIEM